eukprot:6200344-Pleurochrysis_carterae.AAC.1
MQNHDNAPSEHPANHLCTPASLVEPEVEDEPGSEPQPEDAFQDPRSAEQIEEEAQLKEKEAPAPILSCESADEVAVEDSTAQFGAALACEADPHLFDQQSDASAEADALATSVATEQCSAADSGQEDSRGDVSQVGESATELEPSGLGLKADAAQAQQTGRAEPDKEPNRSESSDPSGVRAPDASTFPSPDASLAESVEHKGLDAAVQDGDDAASSETTTLATGSQPPTLLVPSASQGVAEKKVETASESTAQSALQSAVQSSVQSARPASRSTADVVVPLGSNDALSPAQQAAEPPRPVASDEARVSASPGLDAVRGGEQRAPLTLQLRVDGLDAPLSLRVDTARTRASSAARRPNADLRRTVAVCDDAAGPSGALVEHNDFDDEAAMESKVLQEFVGENVYARDGSARAEETVVVRVQSDGRVKINQPELANSAVRAADDTGATDCASEVRDVKEVAADDADSDADGRVGSRAKS